MMLADTIDGSRNRETTHAHHYMLGMRLDYLPVETFVTAFVDGARSGPPSYWCVPDVYQCMICHDDERHRAIVNGANYVMSDSTILQTARALRHRVPRIRTELGARMMLALCAEARDKGVPIRGIAQGNFVESGGFCEVRARRWQPAMRLSDLIESGLS